MGMEIAIKLSGNGPMRRIPGLFIAIALAAFVLMGVAFAIKAASSANEVPLKPCATCSSCPCPTGLNGPRCGCPR